MEAQFVCTMGRRLFLQHGLLDLHTILAHLPPYIFGCSRAFGSLVWYLVRHYVFGQRPDLAVLGLAGRQIRAKTDVDPLRF